MKIEKIIEKAEYYKKNYSTSVASEFAEEIGALISYQSMGTHPTSIKGFFMVSNRIPIIVVNSDLPEIIQSLVIYHECGHLVLNGKDALHTYHDVGLFTKNDEAENSANFFAAEMMLSDEDIFSRVNGEYTFMSMAQELNVPIELLDLKFRIMRCKGYKMVEPQLETKTNFLKNIPVPWENDEPC